jgi:hypothetical protein
MSLAGFHPRLTVLPAASHERPSLAEHLVRLATGDSPTDADEPTGATRRDGQVTVIDADDLDSLAQEIALQRVDEHARRSDDLADTLRSARESEESAASKRDEASARAQRMAAHLEECDVLVDEATHARTAVEQAAHTLDECRAEFEAAHERHGIVSDQREAATRVIEDARRQLRDLESSEMDEATLRRRIDEVAHELRDAQASHAHATELLHRREAQAYERAGTREHLLRERAELVERIESPLYDAEPIRAALAVFDEASDIDHADPVAYGLAEEWLDVCEELERIEAALPPSPTPEELTTAEHQLGEIQSLVAELEATSRHARLDPTARDEIERAHEAVLVAEEAAGQPDRSPTADYELEAARYAEREVLARYGYATYLDVVMAEPEPDETSSELMEALRARRHAEDTVASLWAATEPPPIVTTLRARRDRIYREAAELLCCDPGDNLLELLHSHPAVAPQRTQHLAEVLGAYGVYPVGMSVRDAAMDLLLGIEREVEVRAELAQDLERLDADLVALDDQDAQHAAEIDDMVHATHATAAEVERITTQLESLQYELHDRMASHERWLQRVAAAEELRAQIAAVSEALERSDEEFDTKIADAEVAVDEAESALEEANAALSHAARRARKLSDALPPPLRPKATDDPLTELPVLREVLASEAERADAALTSATRELERARQTIHETEAELDHHMATDPQDRVLREDLRAAIAELIGEGEQPLVLDDPFTILTDEEKAESLDELAEVASQRPVVLLTDDASTLAWAINLPDDVGAVTGLPIDETVDGANGAVDGAQDGNAGSLSTSVDAHPPGAVAPSS